jgi:hypothetical protein
MSRSLRWLILGLVCLNLTIPAIAQGWSGWSEPRALQGMLYRYRTRTTEIAGRMVERYQLEFENVTDDKLAFTWVLESNGSPNSTAYAKVIGGRKTIVDSTSAYRGGQPNMIVIRNLRRAEDWEW